MSPRSQLAPKPKNPIHEIFPVEPNSIGIGGPISKNDLELQLLQQKNLTKQLEIHWYPTDTRLKTAPAFSAPSKHTKHFVYVCIF